MVSFLKGKRHELMKNEVVTNHQKKLATYHEIASHAHQDAEQDSRQCEEQPGTPQAGNSYESQKTRKAPAPAAALRVCIPQDCMCMLIQ